MKLSMDGERVAVLTLDRPPANALSSRSRRVLLEHLDALRKRSKIRCIVLTGTGSVFTAGADLKEASSLGMAGIDSLLTEFNDILSCLEDSEIPVIAAIAGAAVGGGLEVALACDIRIAADEATFIAAGVNVGLIASFWRLPRIIGLGPAKQMLLTGKPCTAETALQWGLVSAVHPRSELLPRALTLAHHVASLPPLAVKATKACANTSHGLDREAADQLGRRTFKRLAATTDHQEAVRSFLERREGHFTEQ